MLDDIQSQYTFRINAQWYSVFKNNCVGAIWVGGGQAWCKELL